MNIKSAFGDIFGIKALYNKPLDEGIRLKGFWEFEVLRNGKIFDKWSLNNIVVTVGLNQLLDVTLGGSSQNASWYIGLMDGSGTPSTVSAAHTMASHSSWTENTNWTGTPTRKTWTKNAVASGGSISNSSSPASFTIGAGGAQIDGVFLNSASTGTAGVLYAEAIFTNKVLALNDVLNVTGTFTAVSA